MQIKRILVTTDFSKTAKKTVEQALILATRFKAEVVVLHARILFDDDPGQLSNQISKLKQKDREAEEAILKCARENTANHGHLNIRHEITRGYSAPSAVLRFINENDFDLVLIGTHGKSALEQLLLGSVAEKVVRYAPCPVLTFHKNATVRQKFSRILVPFDFSEPAIGALQTALLFCEAPGEVQMIYVIDQKMPSAHFSWGMKSVLEIVPDIINKAVKEMNRIASGLQNPHGIQISKKILEGQLHKELAGYMNKMDYDLVLASTHGLVGLDRFLLGSTTERLIRSVHKPILTIKQKNLI